ncbi:MAG: HD domain-containing protein [Thermoplasmata archaeon]|jgi:HD superfamily phosphohydrolase
MGGEYKIIHDSVHGSIKIEEPMLSIVETPEFQRLNGIRQLGFNYLVFPGANHTRLEHSLGVSYIAGEIGKRLNLNDHDITLLKIAGLVHDIGHLPFSHTIENTFKKHTGLDHVKIGEKIVRGEITIENLIGENSLSYVLESNGIDKNEIIKLFSNIDEESFGKSKYAIESIINGDLDADQMDYLIRDSHYTGVAYGVIDLPRILNTVSLNNNMLVFDHKGIEALEGLMVARSLMYSSVYFHKTSRIAELMLIKAIRNMDIDWKILIEMNDSDLLNFIKNGDKFQREIYERLKFRKLYKKVLILNSIPEEYRNFEPERIEKILSDFSGVNENKIIVDIPLQELYNGDKRLKSYDIRINKNGKITFLENESTLVKAIKNRKMVDYSLMVACEKNEIERVENAAKKILVG